MSLALLLLGGLDEGQSGLLMSASSNDALNPVARSGTGVPALAVVDSRNMVHQAEEVLGYRARPTVTGVIDALSLYGFEVLDVHVGLALARSRDREALSEATARTPRTSVRSRITRAAVSSKANYTSRTAVELKRRWSTWRVRWTSPSMPC